MKKVVIGLSGGLDSSMVALMLKEQGYEVIGLHFSFAGEKYSKHLKKVVNELNISVVDIDITDDFEEVKRHFANEYLTGRTPSPCTYCNKIIKWKKLIEFADQNNIDFVASGHYIRKEFTNGSVYLKKGIDPVKDQSYFMWELSSDIIQRMITPLGDFTKNEVRDYARKKGFDFLAERKESMGVCFLQNMDYRQFLKEYIPNEYNSIKEGIVLDEENNVIGKHNGYVNYTIGQKRDLMLEKTREAYVSRINSKTNELTVGEKKSLNHYNIDLNSCHFINNDDICIGKEVLVNVRGLGLNPNEPGIIKEMSKGSITIELSAPAWAVAPGQPVVLYNNDIVLGGGIAKSSW